ncbi:MAG: DUF3472 domain-containing protein [Clostridia bacterium]|nr:DUF3472 domain-containing protein [Clostridia bacterium]
MDWSQRMPLPTQAQLQELRTLRSPYIVYYPQFEKDYDITAFSMDFRIDHEPSGTYISLATWYLYTEARVWSDYGEMLSGYFGFQVLEDGTKAVIMSLWNAFREDEQGNVHAIKAKVIAPKDAGGKEFNPDNNEEGSFVQCLYPYDWKAGRDYQFVLEQKTGENGTEWFTVDLLDQETGEWKQLFCFDSGLNDVSIASVCGFVENFDLETAAWPRSLEFWNVRAKMAGSDEWEYARSVRFTVNNSIGISDYEGSWNFGLDGRRFWIITSGVPGLCPPPQDADPYVLPAEDGGAET